MTLKEAIRKNIGKSAKIGAQSSFFFCGELNSETENTLFNISSKYWTGKKKELEKDIELKKKRIENLLLNPKNNSIKKIISEIQKEIDQTENDLQNWIDFPNRNVRKIYSVDGGEDEGFFTVILFEGSESGSYWTFDEYEKNEPYITPIETTLLPEF